MTIRFDSLASNPPSAHFTWSYGIESITLLSIWQFQVYFGKTKERLCTLRPPSELLSMTLPDSNFSKAPAKTFKLFIVFQLHIAMFEYTDVDVTIFRYFK
ncbi:hypothetical protein Tco_1270218 [Tanacetum coccineum]